MKINASLTAEKNREMKAGLQKIVSATGVVLIACAVMTAFFAPEGLAAGQSFDASNAVLETNADANAAQAGESTTYVIKDCDGYIAVFVKGEAEPIYVTDSLVANLPKADAAYIENGVEVQGSAALAKALEDYCS